MYAKVSVFMDRTHSSLEGYQIDDNCLVKMNKGYSIKLDDCVRFEILKFQTIKENVNGDLIIMSEEDTNATFQEESSALQKGMPVVTVPLHIFMDDLSTNQSKRWSPMHSVHCQLSGLPITKKSKGENVLFLGLSDKLCMTDLFVPVCKDIDQCKSYGIEAYDASTKQNIVLTTEISLLITDFMMMSLACNHMGPAVNKFLS